MKSRLAAIDTEAVLFAAGELVQVAVDHVQLFDVHVVDEPHRPHRVLLSRSLEVLVPRGRKQAGDVRPEVGCDGLLVAVIPVLDNSINIIIILFAHKIQSYA